MCVVVLAVVFDVRLDDVDELVAVAVGAAAAAFTEDTVLPEFDAPDATASCDDAAALLLVLLPPAPARIKASSGRKLRMLTERMPERIRRWRLRFCFVAMIVLLATPRAQALAGYKRIIEDVAEAILNAT